MMKQIWQGLRKDHLYLSIMAGKPYLFVDDFFDNELQAKPFSAMGQSCLVGRYFRIGRASLFE